MGGPQFMIEEELLQKESVQSEPNNITYVNGKSMRYISGTSQKWHK
jgi:hypothetical protein